MLTTNETFATSTTSSPTATAVQTSLCIILLFTGVLGNGTICLLVARFKALRTFPNILLTNLATVDLVNIAINVPLLIFGNVYDIKTLSTITAVWWRTFAFTLFIELNLTSMLLITVDRYLTLAITFKYTLWRTRGKVFCAICAAWVFALFITGCVLMPIHNIDLRDKTVFGYHIAYRIIHPLKNFITLVNVTLMILIIVLSILTILKVLKKFDDKIEENGVQKLRENGQRIKASRITSASTILIVLFVYVTFLLCGVPLFRISFSFYKYSKFFRFLGLYLNLCGSACHSLIYASRSSNFRKALRKTFKFIKCFQNQIQPNPKKAGKVFYINDAFGKKVVVVQ